MVIEGVVYNPTEYLNEHPGGPAVLQNRYGKDASRDFSETGILMFEKVTPLEQGIK